MRVTPVERILAKMQSTEAATRREFISAGRVGIGLRGFLCLLWV